MKSILFLIFLFVIGALSFYLMMGTNSNPWRLGIALVALVVVAMAGLWWIRGQ
jgi:hypothetical protein